MHSGGGAVVVVVAAAVMAAGMVRRAMVPVGGGGEESGGVGMDGLGERWETQGRRPQVEGYDAGVGRDGMGWVRLGFE